MNIRANTKNWKIGILVLCLTSIYSVSAQQIKVSPKPGDGISVLLSRYGMNTSYYYKTFIQLNKHNLKDGNQLILGRKYILPDKKGLNGKQNGNGASSTSKRRSSIVEPLFGPGLQHVPISSHQLDDACFYIVSGHGGPDPGAIGKIGNAQLHEDEYAYDIALRLSRQLMSRGATVRIIIQDKQDGIRDSRFLSLSKRETCDGQPIPLDQVERLRQRCDCINNYYLNDKKNFKYCRAFFIHVDSRSKRNQTDVFFYYKQNSKQSREFAETLQRVFEQKYAIHQPDRGFQGSVSARSLYVLNNTQPVSAFVELGNIMNPLDQKRLLIQRNREALARWIAEGFVESLREQ